MVGDINDITARPNTRARAISVRFSTRARVPDRNHRSAGPVCPGRFQLTTVPGELSWARMRTLQAEVALPIKQV